MVSQEAQFGLVYDGPAVADGVMNVRDLAPAMLAVGTLFEAANTRLNGPGTTVNVNVKATAAGSFEVSYAVVQAVSDQTPLKLLQTAVDLKEYIVGGSGASLAGGLFWLMRRLRNRKPQVEQVNAGLYRLIVDGETFECPIELLRLYQDIGVRMSIAEIVKPVWNEGISALEVRDQGRTIQRVTKEDLPYFDVADAELLTDQTRRLAFSIISLAFREGNKWRLSDGSATYSVTMSDGAFQKRVDANGVAFAKGDVLVCELRTMQWQIAEGVRSEYEVVQVVEHRPVRQMSLFDLPDGSA